MRLQEIATRRYSAMTRRSGLTAGAAVVTMMETAMRNHTTMIDRRLLIRVRRSGAKRRDAVEKKPRTVPRKKRKISMDYSYCIGML